MVFVMTMSERSDWASLEVPFGLDGIRQVILGEPTIHHGMSPACVLPSPAIDLVCATGKPLRAPWGDADMVLHRSFHAADWLPEFQVEAFRLAILPVAFTPSFDGVLQRDGTHPVPSLIRDPLQDARTGAFSYDRLEILKILDRIVRAPDCRPLTAVATEVIGSVSALPGWTVERWSRELGVSSRTLERATRKSTGLPPKRLLSIRRLETAIGRLNQKIPLAQLAFECGYTDQSHMGKQFMRETGCSGTRLRALREQNRIVGRMVDNLAI